jgi:hypothetical protein
VLLRIFAYDLDAARSALQASNIRFEENEVVTVLLENTAGQLAAVSEKLAGAGVNLLAIYLTGFTEGLIEVAIVADDVKKAKKLLQ